MPIEKKPDTGFDLYGVVVEGPMQAPTLMEAEAPMTDYEVARKRLEMLLSTGQWFRGCIVKLTPVWGNEAVLADMQACHTPKELPF